MVGGVACEKLVSCRIDICAASSSLLGPSRKEESAQYRESMDQCTELAIAFPCFVVTCLYVIQVYLVGMVCFALLFFELQPT